MNRIRKMFEKHSVTVFGEKGSGKDMLFANVVCRRKVPYVSNMNYTNDQLYYKLRFSALDTHTSFKQLVNDDVAFYEYPYPLGSDIYISDVGIYLPSQYCNELNKMYPYLPQFLALSRHLGKGTKVHFNVQSITRAWDKLREMSEIYVRCISCKVFFGLVFQTVIVYDKYESAVNRILPCRVSLPMNPFKNTDYISVYRDQYFNQHGNVKKYILIYRNLSNYNTNYFYDLFKGGRHV